MTTIEEAPVDDAELPDIPGVVRIREYSREEWERIARLRQVESDPRQPHSEDWYTFGTFHACASREQHLEIAKAWARKERENEREQRSSSEDTPADCA